MSCVVQYIPAVVLFSTLIGIWGEGRRVVWDAGVDDPLGRPTRIPLDV